MTLNGIDYSSRSLAFFSFYVGPTLSAIVPTGGRFVRTSSDADTIVTITGTGFSVHDEVIRIKFGHLRQAQAFFSAHICSRARHSPL